MVWTKSQRTSWEAPSFRSCLCMVCSVKIRDHWPLFFPRKQSYRSSDFRPLCDNAQGVFMLSLSSLINMDLDNDNVWFQQDGTTAHNACISMGFLREAFPDRLISLRGDINWPACSPDLAPVIISCGIISNSWFITTIHRPWKTYRTPSEVKEPIYRSTCWRE